MLQLLIYALVATLPYLLLPWRFALRLGWAVAAAVLLIWRLTPRTAPDAQTMSLELGRFVLMVLVAAMLVAFVLRLTFEAIRRARQGRPLYEPMPGVDRVLALITGVAVALIYFVALSWVFQGMGNALALHGALAVVAGALLWLAWRRGPGPGRWSAAALGGTALILTAGSLAYPWWVLRDARDKAGNAAHCIALAGGGFAARATQLTFLTFPKRETVPHATLVIAGQEPDTDRPGAHKGPLVWSFHRAEFQGDTYALPGPACPDGGRASGLVPPSPET